MARARSDRTLWIVALVLFLARKKDAASGKRSAADVAPKGPPGELGIVVYPVQGGAKIISPYGAQRGTKLHLGVDLQAAEGTPLLAMSAGKVTFGTDPDGGNIAKLNRSDGSAIYYAHMQAAEGTARDVAAGDVIGYLGKTGNAYRGPAHLHLEVWPEGVYTHTTDPTPMLTAAKVWKGTA